MKKMAVLYVVIILAFVFALSSGAYVAWNVADPVPFHPVVLLPFPVLPRIGISDFVFSKFASRLIACMKL